MRLAHKLGNISPLKFIAIHLLFPLNISYTISETGKDLRQPSLLHQYSFPQIMPNITTVLGRRMPQRPCCGPVRKQRLEGCCRGGSGQPLFQ